MSKGFCDYCYSWGELVEYNKCTTCKEIDDARDALRNERSNQESMRPLYRRDTGGRGTT